jgi:4-hydroxyphenylpyruvate dioxygenase
MTSVELTPDEREANLTVERLKQLVGLIDYDQARGNATQSAHFYQHALGMELVAYSGPETGNRDHKAFVLRSGLVPLRHQGRRRPGQPAARPPPPARRRGRRHRARGARRRPLCMAHARAEGATILDEPHDVTDEHGTVRIAAIATYGDTRHTLVDRSRYSGVYLPGYVARTSTSMRRRGPSGSSRPGPRRRQRRARAHGRVGRLLQPVMGFVNMAEFVGDDIATEYSALMSKVVANGNHRVKFPLNEPAIGKKKPDRRVPGVLPRPRCQHLALAPTTSCAPSTRCARRRRVPRDPRLVLRRPELRARIGEVRVPIEELQKRGILVDRDEDGYLLQIFTKPSGPPDGVLRVHRAARLARSASARATSRRCSRRSSASRPSAATSCPPR